MEEVSAREETSHMSVVKGFGLADRSDKFVDAAINESADIIYRRLCVVKLMSTSKRNIREAPINSHSN